MKIREIILDFTSLLDVIMIILFFFILFSTFEIETATNEANQTKIEYETKIAEVQAEREELNVEWEKIQQIDKNAVKNQQALLEYQENLITINLYDKFDNDTLYINIKKGNNKLKESEYDNSADMNDEIADILKMTDIKTDDIIICTLTYDGDDLYSADAVDKIKKAVNNMQKEYENFYFAANNISK